MSVLLLLIHGFCRHAAVSTRFHPLNQSPVAGIQDVRFEVTIINTTWATKFDFDCPRANEEPFHLGSLLRRVAFNLRASCWAWHKCNDPGRLASTWAWPVIVCKLVRFVATCCITLSGCPGLAGVPALWSLPTSSSSASVRKWKWFITGVCTSHLGGFRIKTRSFFVEGDNVWGEHSGLLSITVIPNRVKSF